MQHLMRNFVYKLSGYLGEYMWPAPRQGGEWSAALGCSLGPGPRLCLETGSLMLANCHCDCNMGKKILSRV